MFHFTYPVLCLSHSTLGSHQSSFNFNYCIVNYWLTLFCSQDFKPCLLSLFWIIFQVDSLSPPLLFALLSFYHVPSPAEYYSTFSFCLDFCNWTGSLWFLLVVKSAPCEWGWTSGLSRFLGWGNLCLCFAGTAASFLSGVQWRFP